MFYVEKRKKNDFVYFCLCVNLGYRIVVISTDKTLISELLGVCPLDLYNMRDDEKRYIKK